MNGSRQPPRIARRRPIGTPRTDATENAPITAPIARPRRAGGTASATIDSAIDVAGSAERARDRTRDHQRGEAVRERACRRARDQAEQRDAQRLAPIEAIQEARRRRCRRSPPPPCSCPRSVRGAPSRCRAPGVVGPERHHHHEVDDVDELDRADQKDDEAFGRRDGGARRAHVRAHDAQAFRLRSRRARNSSNVAQRRNGLLRVSWPIVDVGVSP